MGDLRGGLVDAGSMQGAAVFTFRMSEHARALPAEGPPHGWVGAGFGLVA